jgi:hypothetical protein
MAWPAMVLPALKMAACIPRFTITAMGLSIPKVTTASV